MSKDLALDFSDRNRIANFISNCDSWDGYEGKNVDGERVLVFVNKNEGMVVKTIHHSKPKRYEVVEYDVDGFQVSVSYESVN